MATDAEILAQAKAYHAAGDLLTAELLYGRVLQSEVVNVEAHQLLALVYEKLGKADQAIACLTQAIRLKPDDVGAHNYLGTLLARHGKLDEAISSFEQACRLRPDAAELSENVRYALATKNNKQGNALAAKGELAEAANCFRRALELEPEVAEVHNNLGAVLAEQGKLDEAANCFRRALELKPDSAEAHSNLGAELAKQDKLDEAAQCYRRALELKADYAKAHAGLGAILAKQERFDAAAASYRRALEFMPDDAGWHQNLATVLVQQGKLAEASVCYDRALALNPGSADAHRGLGAVLAAQDRLDEAVASYRRALAVTPDDPDALHSLGTLLTRQERFAEAASCFRRALELTPDFAEAHCCLAAVLAIQENFGEAEASYRRALDLRPDYAEAHNNLAVLLGDQRKVAEAATCFRRALELKPEFADAHHNHAFALLSLGRFAEGWLEYEWRWKRKGFEEPTSSQPRWTGSSLAGRTILLHTEGGAGDALQFIRYAELVKQQGATVIAECRQELVRVLATCAGVDGVVVRGQPLPMFDVYIPLLSLPGVFRTSLANIPAKVPYLWPTAESIAHWKEELSKERKLRVGIVWQGNPRHEADRFRSISLSRFAGIARIPGIRLYSLQVGVGGEQLTEPAGEMPITDLGQRLTDFHDTAAVMVNLDLVITCDSSPAHLAGALGVPVWVALAFSADWRWMLDRTDSPWYPTMRLFRQGAHRDWDGVFQAMEQELAKMASLR